MIIEKQQHIENNYRNRIGFYSRARDAFQAVLSKLTAEGFTLLLPAYIGVSPKEGSGLYDPIISLNTPHQFYCMTDNLEIDVGDLRRLIKSVPGNKAVLIVHYWGYVDRKYEEIVNMVKEEQCIVIEDMAHALYTEYVDNKCGYMGDICFYSLHKMFPQKTGGMLKIRNSSFNLAYNEIGPLDWEPILTYDLRAIAQKRKRNADLWEHLLNDEQDKFFILRPSNIWGGQTPQSFPIAIINSDRYKIYAKLNKDGYGVISLYHTMIQTIQKERFKSSIQLSHQILNLPVHQDVSEKQIYELHNKLLDTYTKYSF